MKVVDAKEAQTPASDDVCNCGPCRRFWRDVLKNSYLAQAKEEGSLAPRTLSKVRHRQITLAVGDRVLVHGKQGSVKFVDFVDDYVVAPVLRVGVRLDESVPEGHNGVYLGKRYFHCTEGHGIFAQVTEVVPLPSANRRPSVRGNSMFPSWNDVCQKRRKQEAELQVKEERRKKAAARRMFLSRQAKLPSISPPRETRANQMRREMICLAKMPEACLTFREDPSDVAVKDQHKKNGGKKKDPLMATISLSADPSQPTMERGLRKQWREKYHDPEKVSRMMETMLKLHSAYQEGSRFKRLYSD
ncbi:hypothetical protein ACOMHN_010362 [Nucella lapillus]